MSFEQVLTEWLPQQRWFATKSAHLDAIRVHELGSLADSRDVRLLLHVVEVDAAGSTTSYFVPTAWHHGTQPGIGVIGAVDDWVVHDGAHDPGLSRRLMEVIASAGTVGAVSAGRTAELPAVAGAGRPLGVEQSNTSLVYDDTLMLKLFRRLTASPNPDLEVNRALGAMGSKFVAPALGWLEGAGFTLAIVQPFLRGGSEGWALALTSVRDLYAQPQERAAHVGGDFAPEAERLGAATAGLHADLRAAFGSRELEQPELAELADLMLGRLEAASAAVPALRPLTSRIADAYKAVAVLDTPHTVQRIHGDFHLGQVLRTETGWVVLDFEGEPARPREERVAQMSPLRDVAGMLRSFDYAAMHLIADHERSALLDLRAHEWTARNRDSFCTGYATVTGSDPRAEAELLRAFELDKAVYEVRYEADHRPSWLSIPLAGVERLVA
jgi:maltokinase